MEQIHILIYHKDTRYTYELEQLLSNCKNHYEIFVFVSLKKALDAVSHEKVDFFITEPEMLHGNISIRNLIDIYSGVSFLMVTRKPSFSEGSQLLKEGVCAYFDLAQEQGFLIKKINELHREKKQQEAIQQKFAQDFFLDSKSELFQKMMDQCRKVANSNANILLIGESGTGKEVAAKYIHLCSKRSTETFVTVNCSAFTETLLESELFGHEQGAFTGAVKSKPGRFEIANKGTLFLDEVGDINVTTQIKLLRTLETKKIERMGSNEGKLIDFRLVSATHKDLLSEIVQNKYREDFFYRISTIVITVPPLRKRIEDLPQLIQFFLKQAQKENNITVSHIEPEPEKFLYTYEYPGNIRELKNIVERMVILVE